jgi:HK97 family phage portal protein
LALISLRGGFFSQLVSNILGTNRSEPVFNRWFGGAVDYYDANNIQLLVHEGYVTNPHVFSVVNNLTTSALQIPWFVYQVKDQSVFKRYIAHKNLGNWEEMLKIEHKAVDLFQGENDWTRLIKKPNSQQTWEEFIQILLAMRYLTGNSYFHPIFINLRVQQSVDELIPLPSQYMKVIPKVGWIGTPESYKLYMGGTETVEFTPSEVEHIKMFNPLITAQTNDNGELTYTLSLYGQSPLTSLAKVIRQSNDGFTAQMKLLQNGHPLGILSNGSAEPMTDKEAESAQKIFNKGYGGAENKGKIKLTTANLKWINMGMNSVDLQLADVQNASLAQVCAAYGLPAPNVTGQNANFNTSKEAEKQKWNDAILPHFNVIRDHINRKLKSLIPNSENIYIDYDHRSVPSLQQDLDRQTKIIMSQMEHGLLNGEIANRMLMNDVAVEDHHKKFVIATNLRYTDEPLPGMTGLQDGNQR